MRFPRAGVVLSACLLSILALVASGVAPSGGLAEPAAGLFILGAMAENARGLGHPDRRRIYEHLLMVPGDYFRSVVRALRMSYSTSRHHVDVLINLGYLRSEKANGRVRYYPSGRDSEAQKNHLFKRHWDYRDLRLRVLFALRRCEIAGPSEIGRKLGISRQLAAYHLACLEEAGYIRKEYDRYRA